MVSSSSSSSTSPFVLSFFFLFFLLFTFLSIIFESTGLSYVQFSASLSRTIAMNRDAVTLLASTLRNVASFRSVWRRDYSITAVSARYQSRNKRGTETDYNVAAKFYALCSVFRARYNFSFPFRFFHVHLVLRETVRSADFGFLSDSFRDISLINGRLILPGISPAWNISRYPIRGN